MESVSYPYVRVIVEENITKMMEKNDDICDSVIDDIKSDMLADIIVADNETEREKIKEKANENIRKVDDLKDELLKWKIVSCLDKNIFNLKEELGAIDRKIKKLSIENNEINSVINDDIMELSRKKQKRNKIDEKIKELIEFRISYSGDTIYEETNDKLKKDPRIKKIIKKIKKMRGEDLW